MRQALDHRLVEHPPRPRARSKRARHSSRSPLPGLILLLGIFATVAGCNRNQDPEGAAELWDFIQAAEYRLWARPPGYEVRTAGTGPHGAEVDIFINVVVEDALAAGGPLGTWPALSLIVKDAFMSNGEQRLVGAMEKRGAGWFWARWKPDGETVYSGSPGLCTNCHDSGADFVRAFELP